MGATPKRRRRLRPVNGITTWILHTPVLRRLADRQVCELRFVGVRSGRTIKLPVMYAERDNRVVVLVGGPQRKRWWRNFLRPHPVEVWLRGRTRPGTGRVVRVGAADRYAVEQVYRARFPDIAGDADPFVLITLVPQTSSLD